MLQCPRCSNPLTVAECPCSDCIKTVTPNHITSSMGRDLFHGGVIQYPSSAILQTPPTNHEYQNTVSSFKTPHDYGPQNPSVSLYQNSSTCGADPVSVLATGTTLGTSVGAGHQLKSDYASTQTLNSNMMYPPNLSGQYLLQQAKQEQQQINAELINLQIKVLQNQLQQAKLQQEMIKTQSQTVSFQPQVPTQLVTTSVSLTTSPCLSSAFSPPTPAILVAANQSPFFSTQPNVTFNVTSPWCPPSFTPPPEVPLPRPTIDVAEVLRISQTELEQCCWYYGSLSWQESSMLLQNTAEGTFLVRDSQDHRFLYSLSVQRHKEGPTSVRIQFSNGKFSLDAEERIRELMPRFNSVGELVEHYVSLGEKHSSSKEVFVDQKLEERKIHSPIILRQPLFKKTPTLAHFSRIAINRSMGAKRSSVQASAIPKQAAENDEMKTLNLPPKLVEFLKNYPLSI
eukprot:GFUD01004924.1.p1 GENE.GFUD01004924.1~~GFUD01004924.1.p1  ORF type:complete len:455 (+),score=44.61 GFUD01004924.1:870-2234(+)